MAKAAIQRALEASGIYTAYYMVSSGREAPYITWRGSGQDNFSADDIFVPLGNTYIAEYSFLEKSEEMESAIETALIDNGFRYAKSEDYFDEDTKEYWLQYDIHKVDRDE